MLIRGDFVDRSAGPDEMLVLSRRIGEDIRIGSCVNLRVLGISQGRVKLGIAGPRTVDVTRAELVDGTTVNAQQPAGSSQLTDED